MDEFKSQSEKIERNRERILDNLTEQEKEDIERLDKRRKRKQKQGLKRSGTDTVILKRLEEEKAKETFDPSSIQNIKNKLGLSQNATEKRVKEELQRIAKKSTATRKALKLTEEDFERFGIKT